MSKSEALRWEEQIAADPEDDGIRLVYADWLDDHDGSVICERCRGRWLRSEVEMLARGHSGAGWLYNQSERMLTCEKCGGTGEVPGLGRASRAEFIRRQLGWLAADDERQQEILAVYGREWSDDFDCEWARGFPEVISVNTIEGALPSSRARTLLGTADIRDRILHFPVKSVIPKNRMPVRPDTHRSIWGSTAHFAEGYCWLYLHYTYQGDRAQLPREVYVELEGFEEESLSNGKVYKNEALARAAIGPALLRAMKRQRDGK